MMGDQVFNQVTQRVLQRLYKPVEHRPWDPRRMEHWEALDAQTSCYDTQSFMISCGTVTIDKAETSDRLILLVFNKKLGVWQLPKGRKDIHEDLAGAAYRETAEETGIAVQPLYLRFGTRLTLPSTTTSVSGAAVTAGNKGVTYALSKDMFFTTVYPEPDNQVMRHIYWYAAKPAQGITPRRELMSEEDIIKMETRWFSAAEAVSHLRMIGEKEAVALAVHYAEQMSEEDWQHSHNL